jgi:hypothetical protein
MKFQPTKPGRPRKNTADNVGKVRVLITMDAPGNLTHSFTIDNVRVSQIAMAIRRALFGERATQ